MDGITKRVLNRCVSGVQPLWNFSSINCWRNKIWAKSPVDVNAEDRTIFTNMRVSFITSRAIPARKMAPNGDKVAHRWRADSFSNSNNFTARLMTGDGAQGNVFSTPFIPLPDVYVRSTNRGGMGLDENFVFSGLGDRVLLTSEATNRIEGFCPCHHGLRNGHHARPPQLFSECAF